MRWYNAAPSCTSRALMMITGSTATSRQVARAAAVARLRRPPQRSNKWRCSGAKRMPRITAQKIAPEYGNMIQMKAMVTKANNTVRALFCRTVSFIGVPRGLNHLVHSASVKVPLIQINTCTAAPT
ncbi:hypothetical protein WR25_01941 [Diploscapter pachys]|uniref:Uncharacterized protein n=1 Tax=Diploscapter pachys TaxID=2018661 RepID=A0A2A2M5I4_9BILA|nr:hypothetical protein WR25_01941 [Diploscapter pachys]